MKTRIFVTIIALVLFAACSAFDKGNEPYEGFDPSVVPPLAGGGQFEGTYIGEMTLTENSCEDLAEEIDSKTPLTLNIVQSGQLVSVGFEDESEASGTLDGNRTTVISKEVSDTKIFHLEFTDTGITGDCEYIEGAPIHDQLGDPCAKYSVTLTKE